MISEAEYKKLKDAIYKYSDKYSDEILERALSDAIDYIISENISVDDYIKETNIEEYLREVKQVLEDEKELRTYFP